MRKILIFISLFCLTLTVAGITAFIWVRSELASSLPELSGTLTLNGLSQQVDIYRDEYGIPHIYAENPNDLMFAVGFVCAQDRLWQMDLTRRAATGRLAEILGESVLNLDLLVRTLGFEQIAKRQIKSAPRQTAAGLEAFSHGVNACITHLPALPPEFRLLKYEPEPWQPFESLAISRLLAWQLSKNFKSEIVMMKLVDKLGAERAAELGPAYPPAGPFIISAEPVEGSAQVQALEEGARLLDGIVGSSGGSNSWVIGPSRTTNNAAILANDPHLSGTKMPSIWYYVHLVGGEYDVIGGVVPGIPLPMLGHNRRIGWGSTNMNADVQDLFIERINPQDPNQYEYNGRWVDMDSRWERIYFRTKNGDRSFIEKEVRLTIHGPLMNETMPGLTNAISLKWTGFEPSSDFEALAGINLARGWDQFRHALSKFTVAPQNFIYADIDGNIGYYGAGVIPVRSESDGTTPQKGWTGETAWKGRIPFDEMPHAFNPTPGYIVTANNRVVGDRYEHFLSAEWAPRFRYQRIAELIEQQARHDVESVARIQSDTKSPLAELLLDSLMPAFNDLSDPLARDAADVLKEWNFDNTTESTAATIYHEFLLKFAKNTFIDELGWELVNEYLDNYYLWIERFVRFVQEDSPWFDDVRTDQVETRDDIAVRSFEQAITSLHERLGSKMTNWRWGNVHAVEFRHPLDRSMPARMIFNQGPFPFPGDGESVNRGTFAFNEPYSVTMAASLRHIMDFSRLNNTLAIHTTGQSGNPVSPHYHDFTKKWLKGQYVTMMMDREDFTGGAEGHLILLPAERPSHP